MGPVETIVRFARLAPSRRLLLAEAAANLARAGAAIRWHSFRSAIGFGAIPLGALRDAAAVDDLVRAVEAAAARLPWRSVCFDQGLALQRALRRRGHDARLHYGLSRPGAGDFMAHVWVELGGRILIGAEEAGGHHSVAVFPATR